MASEVTIQDLPDEMLEKILLLLELEERKSALTVCKRWSTLKPFDWSSVKLKVDLADRIDIRAKYLPALLRSNRPYKELEFHFYGCMKDDLFEDILRHFSCSVESLMFFVYSEIGIMYAHIAYIAAHCSNLKYLHIKTANIIDSEMGFEIAPMNKLEELDVENVFPYIVPNMQEITPNISKLRMTIDSYQACKFLQHVSSRLSELDILSIEKTNFLTVCRINFPLLEKLNINFKTYRKRDNEWNGIIGPVRQFLQRLPGLKKVTLREKRDDRVVRRLYDCCRNVEFLCLTMYSINEESFQAICQLQHLKHLQIESAIIGDRPLLNFPPLKSLQILTLCWTSIMDPVHFKRFLSYAFPNLTVLEMLHTFPKSLELQANVSSNTMSSLQRLVLYEFIDIPLEYCLQFCAFTRPRELRLQCGGIMAQPMPNKTWSIPVQTLILNVDVVSSTILRKIIGSMGELSRVELQMNKHCTPELIQILQADFPRCKIIGRKRVQIKEPL